ncbi:Uncharacterised protein [Brevibacterium casei]|uniref:Uncharacterized protein n=1 Tax=Brevibacterium casei TaxID=33889 RepID=A0A449D7U6_9MICO|nr:hypothetical protein [Brevibacterium casei]VEW13518.1 Uncharacterised protein [Brevibacterium casei]
MADEIMVATITISYEMDDLGDLLTNVNIEGDIPIVTQLGLLEMAKDSILIGIDGDED